MSTFTYEAMRAPGEIVQGELEAEDASAASVALLRRGYHILRLEDAGDHGHAGARVGGWKGIKRREIIHLTRDLANLLKAGLPLNTALRALRERAASEMLRRVMGGLRARLEDGQSFSEALRAYPAVFDSVYVNLVHAGEEGGKLVDVLNRIARLRERREDLRSRALMAMVYPAVLTGLGIVTVIIMMTLVVPMFTEVFQESRQTLPLPTAILIGVSDMFAAWWWILVPALAVAIVATVQLLRTEVGRVQRDRALVRLPMVRGLVQRVQVAAFARTLGTLLDSGIPIVRALHITAATQGNSVYSANITATAQSVRDGEVLSRALAASPFFPPTLPQILAVGEQSGTLVDSLSHVATETEEAIEREVKVVMTLIEPAMIVVLGTVVGFIVLAMLLPIFSLGDSLQL